MKSLVRLIRRYRPWTTTKEIPHTVGALLWFIFSAAIAGATNAYLDQANPFVRPDFPQRWRVHDPLLEFLSPYYIEWGLSPTFPDTLVNLTPLFLFSRILLAGSRSCVLIRRVFYLTGLAFLIRSFICSITMLPNPNLSCIGHTHSNFWVHTFELIIQVQVSCGDVVFSGHTIIFMLGPLVWLFNPHPIRPLHYLVSTISVLFSATGIISLVASTYHYTLDCILSLVTMIIIWRSYYRSVTTPLTASSSWFHRFIHYIDRTPSQSSPLLPVTQQDMRQVDPLITTLPK